MTFDPVPFDLTSLTDFIEFLPKIRIFDIFPVFLFPAMNPFGNALFDILGIGIDHQFVLLVTKQNPFNGSRQLHTVVSSMIFTATDFVFLLAINNVRTPTA